MYGKKNLIGKTLVLLSGGVDSTVTSVYASTRGYKIIPVFYRYGQLTENKELLCVLKLSKLFGFERPIIINLPWLKAIS
jgi:7-cyano-7-deazaguanine synthase